MLSTAFLGRAFREHECAMSPVYHPNCQPVITTSGDFKMRF
jgi:hypothetical protein